jgi:hypothetical protein
LKSKVEENRKAQDFFSIGGFGEAVFVPAAGMHWRVSSVAR